MRRWVAEKIYRLGPTVIETAAQEWGVDPATFHPEAYGDYIATSVAVYAAANYRAKNLAKLPLRLWKVGAGGNRKEVTSGRCYELLVKVNPYWTWGRMVRMTELARCLWGSAYWALERGESGRQPPREMWWVRPDTVRVVPDRVDYLKGFVVEGQGERIPFGRDEMIWLRMDNPIDEFSGLSPLAAARLSADLGIAGLRSNKKLFDQGMQLGGIISPADRDTAWIPEQVEAYSEFFDARFKGIDKAHRWAVLSRQINATPLGVNPKDAEFVTQMRMSLGDVARVYFLPPEVLGDHERATYSNIDQAYKAVWTDCLQPEADEIAEDVTEQLLPLFGEADLAEFDFSGIASLQEDRSEIVAQMETLGRLGVPLNRLLEEFMPNLLPADGKSYDWGDRWWIPVTQIPAGTEPPEIGPPAGTEEELEPAKAIIQARELVRDLKLLAASKTAKTVEYGSPEHELLWKRFVRRADGHEAKFKEAVVDLFRRQQESVLARLRGGKAVKAPKDEPFSLAEWIKKFKAAGLPLLRVILQDSGDATLEELRERLQDPGSIGVDFDLNNPAVVRFLEGRAQRFAREVNETTWNRLKESLAEGIDAGEAIRDLEKRVEDIMGDRIRSSAETIARTEVVSSSNFGAMEAARQSGVVEGKEWLAALDSRTRPEHVDAHGQTRKLEEKFDVGGEKLMQPGEGSAAMAVNCRCTVVFTLKED